MSREKGAGFNADPHMIELLTAIELGKHGIQVDIDERNLPVFSPVMSAIISTEKHYRPNSRHGLFSADARVVLYLKLIDPQSGEFVLGGFGGVFQMFKELNKAVPDLFKKRSSTVLFGDDLSRLLSEGRLDLTHEHLVAAHEAGRYENEQSVKYRPPGLLGVVMSFFSRQEQ